MPLFDDDEAIKSGHVAHHVIISGMLMLHAQTLVKSDTLVQMAKPGGVNNPRRRFKSSAACL